jgi:hypothetical protein
MGRFVNVLKARTRSLHTAQQLRGEVHRPAGPARPGAITNFARYLAEQRAVHAALTQFPVRLPVDFVEALETDLWFLELEAWHADMPWLLQDPYASDYAAALDGLPMPQLACHWYNLVFAHLVGGNRRLADAAVADVLPPHWLDTSAFYGLPARVTPDDLDDLRDRLEAEARRWSPQARRACVDETPRAFARASTLNAFLLPKK